MAIRPLFITERFPIICIYVLIKGQKLNLIGMFSFKGGLTTENGKAYSVL